MSEQLSKVYEPSATEKLANEIMEEYEKSEYKSKAEILLSIIKLKA